MSTNRQLVIVVADDLSETGEIALREGLRRGPFVQLHVAHVVTDDDLSEAEGDTLLERQDTVLEKLPSRIWDRIGSLGTEIGGLPELEVSVHVRFGVPSEALRTVAADYEADMIIVGTHGRRGMEKLVLGSVSSALIRDATCPVMVARLKDHSRAPRSDRPEPARPGEDLHKPRPERPHVYTSTRSMTWGGRDVDAVGPDW